MTNVTTTGAIAQTFTFSAHTLRVIMRDGNPWFVASDVCEAIGIKNHRDSVERLDDDEKGVASTDTPGGAQEMLIVNESGLNAIILRSRDAMTPGTPSHKYRKWVTAEVLPAIRKTGRYVEPQAPARVVEHLAARDLQAIKRMIWFAVRGFQHEGAWTQAVWFYLRQVLGLPSPHQFSVDQLPRLAIELHRINAISWQVQDVISEVEREAVRRMFRKGECADVVLADLKRLAAERMAEVSDDMAKMPAFLLHDVADITLRTHPDTGVAYVNDEQSGYFVKHHGSAA